MTGNVVTQCERGVQIAVVMIEPAIVQIIPREQPAVAMQSSYRRPQPLPMAGQTNQAPAAYRLRTVDGPVLAAT
jgi:hypothetical protein